MHNLATTSDKLLSDKKKTLSDSDYDKFASKIPLKSIEELAEIQRTVKNGDKGALSRTIRIIKHIPIAIYKSVFDQHVRSASIQGVKLTFQPKELKNFRSSLVRILGKWDYDYKGNPKVKQPRQDQLNDLKKFEVEIPNQEKLQQIHEKVSKRKIVSGQI